MDIKYTIEIFNYWHCGSGLSRGADTDALVIKDKNNLPFVPGKTIKGLMREAAEDYIYLAGEKDKEDLFKTLFGETGNRSETHFGNAVLSKAEENWIISNKAQKHLYSTIARTAIGEDGIAKEHSLRSMEVTVPCTLHGEIVNAPEGAVVLLKQAVGMIKNLGSNRYHGLGRCIVKIEEGGKE